MEGMEYLIVIFVILGVLMLIGLYLGLVCKWYRLRSWELLLVQGFGDIREVKGPGIRFLHPWEEGNVEETLQISVDVETLQQEAWLYDPNTGEHQPIDMTASEVSIDCRLPKDLTPENARAFVAVKGALFEDMEYKTLPDGDVIITAKAGQYIRDDVSAIIRRYWANKDRPYQLIRGDKGGLANFIKICLKGMHQPGCMDERIEYFRAARTEIEQQLRDEANFRMLMIQSQYNLERAQLHAAGKAELAHQSTSPFATETAAQIADRYKQSAEDLEANKNSALWEVQEQYNLAVTNLNHQVEKNVQTVIELAKKEKHDLGSDNWGIEIVGVSVNRMGEADEEMAKAAQTPAKVTFAMKGKIAEAHAEVEIARQQVRVAEQQGLAFAKMLEQRADAIRREFNLSPPDAAQWMLKEDGIRAVQTGWSLGGGAVIDVNGLLNRFGGGGTP